MDVERLPWGSGNWDGGNKGLFPTPGTCRDGCGGGEKHVEGNISPCAFLLQDSSGTNGTCSATGKGASRAICGVFNQVPTCPECGNDRNSKCWGCHLRLSPRSALNPQSFCLHRSAAPGKLGRPPVEDTDFLRCGRSFKIPWFPTQKPKAVAGMGESPTRHKPLQTELEEKQTRGIEVHRFY